MRLRPFFKCYGSKYTLAPKYPEPLHKTVVEPFAGSAQYSTLHYEKDVILVERDPEIAALWAGLVSADPDQIRALPAAALTEGLDIRTLPCPKWCQLLIRAWQRVGRTHCWTVSKWNCANTGLWHPRTRDRIADQVSAIRHWKVIQGDITQIMPTQAATWFVDPPYQGQPDVYGGKGSGPNFHSLARWVKGLTGQVIVCEAEGADWLPFERLSTNLAGRTSQGGTRKRGQEMIWCNT